jgi:hypothetical protein
VSARSLLSRAVRALRPRPADRRPTTAAGALTVEYSPTLDGDADPGEIVWTWVPYVDDPRQGKDRPVVILGRRGARLVGVALSSKHRHGDVPVGTGQWDAQRRPSYAKVDRLLDIDPSTVRREGAILDRRRFDEVAAAIRGGPARDRS